VAHRDSRSQELGVAAHARASWEALNNSPQDVLQPERHQAEDPAAGAALRQGNWPLLQPAQVLGMRKRIAARVWFVGYLLVLVISILFSLLGAEQAKTGGLIFAYAAMIMAFPSSLVLPFVVIWFEPLLGSHVVTRITTAWLVCAGAGGTSMDDIGMVICQHTMPPLQGPVTRWPDNLSDCTQVLDRPHLLLRYHRKSNYGYLGGFMATIGNLQQYLPSDNSD
jgi:hypothetical protein